MGRLVLPRRRFLHGGLIVVSLGLVSGCSILPPQVRRPMNVPRVGMLLGSADTPYTVRNREAFRQGLADLGYTEGQDVIVEPRYSGAGVSQSEQAAELARIPVDVIVTSGDPSMRAAQQATQTIPIVFALNSAPVESGVVASLARPGGNITGLTEITPELSAKRLELLRETIPSLARAGVIWSPQFSGPALQFREADLAAREIGLGLLSLPVRAPEEFEGAFAAAARGQVEALVVLPGAITNAYSGRVVGLAAASRLPAVYGDRVFVEAGGLMSYGANVAEMYRRAATYVDKILKGAGPADLPVERPSKLELLVNLKTARSLGLTMPQSVLLQATEIFE